MTSVGETEADELGSASLRRSAVRGVGWSALQTVASRSLSTVVFVVLARLVEPEDFGLVAIASVFVALLTVLADQGFGQALVQRPVLERTHLDTAFWLNVTIGALLALLLAGTAGAIANLFDEADLAPLLRALAMVPLVSALGVVPSSLLRRDLAFASLAVRGLVGTAAGGVVGIAAAVAGAGAWALVAQLVVQTAVQVVTVWLACPWRPGRELTAASARDLIGFGGSVTAAAVVNFLNRRSDDFLVGLVLGSTALGFYTLAYKLLLLMTDVLTRTIEVVAFPVLARVGGDQRRLASGFYTANRVSSAVAAPAFLFVAAFAPEVVEVAFGSEWAASASVLRALALMGLLQASLLSHSTLVAAAGRPALSLLVTAVNGVANLAAFALVVRHGIVAVAVAYAVVGYLLAPLSLWTVRRVLAFDVRRYLAIVAGPALAAAVAVGLVLLLDEALESLPTAARLGAAALATLALYALALRLTVPAGAAELLDLAKGALPGSRPA